MENPKVRPWAYGAAALISWSRVQAGEHTAVQAIAGAALGYGLGHLSGVTKGGLFHGLFCRGRAGHRKHPAAPAQAAVEPKSEEPAGASPSPTVGGAGPMVELWEVRW